MEDILFCNLLLADNGGAKTAITMNQHEAFRQAYSNVRFAGDLLHKIGSGGVMDVTREETSGLQKALQDALCAATALDNWRRMNPKEEK